MKIPEGQQAIMPYLILKNAAGFIEFMQTVFSAKEKSKYLRDDQVTIMHAEIEVHGSMIMLAESTDDYPASNAGMFIYVEDADVAYNKALELGAKSIMPVEDKDYGRSGGVKDPFGNDWWITAVK